MAQTVTEVLTAATDSVTLINAVNGGSYDVTRMTQEEINEMVQRNVDHLELILAYAPVDEDDETQMSQVTPQISLAIQVRLQLEGFNMLEIPMMVWNILITLVFVPILNSIRVNTQELKRLEILVNKTREEIAKEYVTKLELRNDMGILMDRIDKIGEKLDKLFEVK
jgi:hypothetical protein